MYKCTLENTLPYSVLRRYATVIHRDNLRFSIYTIKFKDEFERFLCEYKLNIIDVYYTLVKRVFGYFGMTYQKFINYINYSRTEFVNGNFYRIMIEPDFNITISSFENPLKMITISIYKLSKYFQYFDRFINMIDFDFEFIIFNPEKLPDNFVYTKRWYKYFVVTPFCGRDVLRYGKVYYLTEKEYKENGDEVVDINNCMELSPTRPFPKSFTFTGHVCPQFSIKSISPNSVFVNLACDDYVNFHAIIFINISDVQCDISNYERKDCLYIKTSISRFDLINIFEHIDFEFIDYCISSNKHIAISHPHMIILRERIIEKIIDVKSRACLSIGNRFLQKFYCNSKIEINEIH